MLYDLKIYGKLAVMAIRSKMQYRADFIAGLLGVFALNTSNTPSASSEMHLGCW